MQFNARSESVGEKPSFRRLLTRTRCLVPVEGFYEWKKDGSKKQPYYIHFKDGRPLVLAALYDHWQNSEGETLYTFTILTTSASSALLWLHDRMPVILGNKKATDAWLIGSSSSKFDAVLKPYEDSDLVWYAVSSAMGKPSLDGPECVKEIQLKTEDKGTISKFFRKEIKEELESKKEGRTCDKSPRTVVLKSVKDEYESEDKLEKPSFKMVHQDLKSSLSTTRNEDQTKCKIKRGHEELLSDPKWDSNKNDSLHSSPAKIAKPKNSDDKRSTLFSYYGRK
uniref:Embryonic stem cell-specific 5-hydroxymethylcytosine-binding protein-like n=1 Tax=Rhizophora mucronata TaxID=61149 RepID=A0A2P2K313_RHIMU